MVRYLFIFLFSLATSYLIADTSKPNPISPSSTNAAETGVDYWFFMEIEQGISTGDYLNIVFPAAYSGTGLGSGKSCSINDVAHSCVEGTTNIITITMSSTISSVTRLRVKVPNITNPGTSIGTGYFKIFSQMANGLQIIDHNDAFGVIGFAKTVTTMTGAVTSTTIALGKTSDYTFTFTLVSALSAGSTFMIIIPSPFSVISTTTCTPVAYTTGGTVIAGTYTCTSSGNVLVMSGLSTSLAAGAQVGIKVTSIMNPSYSVAASTANFIVQTMMPNSEIIVDRAIITSLSVAAGTLSAVTHSPYTTGSDFDNGNKLYTMMNFTTATAIPVGGVITIDYGATLDGTSSCFVMSGVPNKTDGSFYACSVSGNVATISNFGAIDAGKAISIVNLLTTPSSDVTSATITTSINSNTIDTNSGTGGITLNTGYTGSQPTSVSLSYSGVAGGTGSVTISMTRTYASTAETFTIYVPSEITITSGDTVSVTWSDGSGTPPGAIAGASYSGNTIMFQATITSAGSSTSSFLISTTSGFNYPTLATSYSHPLEWVVEIGTDSLTTIQTTLSPKAFDVTAGKTEILYSGADSIYYPYTFNVQVDLALTIVGNRKLFFWLTFPTTSGGDGFADKLGTGYTNGVAMSIPCSPYTLKDLSTAVVACTVTTGASSSTVTISNFNSITASTLVSFTLLLKNGYDTYHANVKIQSGYQDHNSIKQVVQEKTIQVAFTAAAADWTTATITQSNTLVGTVTPLNFTLELPTDDSSANDCLLLVFPSLWSINSKTFSLSIGTTAITKYSLFTNTYAPAVFMTVGEVISHTTSNILTVVGMKNGPYESSGSGSVQVTMITNTTLEIQASTSSATIASATRNALTLSVSPNSMHQNAGDVTFRFSIVNPTAIPASGKIIIVFPTGFSLTYSTCSYSYLLSSASACVIDTTNLKISISGFTAIAAGTSFSVKVLTVKNPTSTASGSFTVTTYYDNAATQIIDTATYTGFNMTSAAVSGSVYIGALSFFPMSANTKGRFLLDFSLDSSVPHGGNLIITVPSTFTLPSTLDTSNCIFNLQYSSCSKSGNTITINPYRSFPAGIEMILVIPDITVPTNSTTPISISSMWSSLTMSTNPATVTSAFYLNTYAATTTAITATINFWPKNAAEMATYNFSLTAASQFNTTFSIVIWFPDEYPASIGDLKCSSTASMLMTGALSCDSSSYLRGVVLKGFSQITAGTAFNIIIENVANPISPGSTSAFSIVSIDSSNKVVDQLMSAVSVTIASLPSLLTLKSIALDNYAIFATTSYTFTSTFSSIPSKFQIWYRFPMENFDRELPGLSDSYNCSTLAVSSSATTSSWISSVTCSNPYHNLLIMSGASGSISSTYLQTTFKSVKSPQSEGISKSFIMSVFNVDTMAIVDRSYGTASSGDVVSYIDEKQDIIINTADGMLEITPGTQIKFYIHTSSTKMPVRSDLTFTYELLGNGVKSLVTISPTSIVLSKGTISSPFTIMCPTGSSTGNYTIRWTMSGDTYGLYNEPPMSKLIISNDNTYAVSFEGIPTLMAGSSSIPLYVYLETPPSSGLSVTFTPPTYITVSALSFAAGSMAGAFTIKVDSNITVGIYTISLKLAGTDASSFYLSSSSLHVTVSNYDTTLPGIASFVINNPKQQHMVDISFQATEASIFYYTYGERGLALPTNTSLISLASNSTTGYYTGYIGASFIYDFQISGLTTEHDYILYGILIDLNQNVMESVFSVDFYTAEYYDSIMITLKFSSAVNTTLLTTTVVSVLAQQLAISSSLIAYVTPTSRMLDDSFTSANYYVYSDPTSSLPSPQDSVTYMAIPSELYTRLAAYGIMLDLTWNIANSITTLSNPRPTWVETPSATTTTKTAVTIYLKCSTAGTLYMQVINDGDVVPSSRQITLGVDAYGKAATMVYNQTVTANTNVTITYGNLLPESSYVVVITTKNSNARLPRVMSDDVMAKLQIITQAGTISSDGDNNSTAIPLSMFGVLLLLPLQL